MKLNRNAILVAFFLLPLSLSGETKTASDKGGEPYRNGTSALAKGDFEEARRWFGITHHDFPKSDEGKRSLLQESFLLVANELANLRLSSLWKEAADLTRVESGQATTQKKKSEEYEKQAKEFSDHLKKLTPDLLAMESLTLPLSFEVDSSGWEVDDLRARVKKGEILDAKEIKRLEKGEFLTNYLGFVTTVLHLPEDRLFVNPYEGSVTSTSFFNAIGSRLAIANRAAPDPEKVRLAKECFNRVITLTDSTPYDKERLEAKDFLEKLGNPSSPAKMLICPFCKRSFSADFKFCPYDGRKLGPSK